MDTNSKVDAVFARATDFEIVDAIHTAIEQHYGFETIRQRDPRVPYDRWVVHTVISCTGYFECEGYSYFWGADCDHRGLVEGLKVLGAPIEAMIIEEAIGQVPKDVLGDWDAADDFFGGEDERIAAAKDLDDAMIDNPKIMDKASKYVRLHRYSYLDLLDEIDKKITEWRETIKEYEK